MLQNIDPMLAEEQGVTVELDKVSAKKGTKYSTLTVHLEGGYKFEFFLNDDKANIIRMLLAGSKK